MNSIKTKIPSNWQQVKLGDVLDKMEGGGTPSKEREDFWGGNIPWASVKDVVTHNPYGTQDYITQIGLQNSSSRIVPKETLIVPTRMALGHAVFFQVDVAINQDLKALYPSKSTTTTYLYHWFKSKKTYIERLGSGSTVSGIQQNELKSIKFLLPPLPEQHRIVTILETWDNAIDLLKKKIALKKQVKKGLMQRLLSGDVRLPGFGGEWKNQELGELLNYEQPTKYLVNSTDYSDVHATPVLTAGKTFLLGYTNETDGIFNDLPVIIFDDFTTANKFVIFPFKVKSSAMKMLSSKNKDVNLKFIFERMQFIHFPVGEHKRQYLSEYQYIPIKVPNIEEQNAIAEFSEKADREITLLEQKLHALEEQKKFLLNNLVTGEIRTPEDLLQEKSTST